MRCRDAMMANGDDLIPRSCPTCGRLGPCKLSLDVPNVHTADPVPPTGKPDPTVPLCPFCGAAAHSTFLFGRQVFGCRTAGCMRRPG